MGPILLALGQWQIVLQAIICSCVVVPNQKQYANSQVLVTVVPGHKGPTYHLEMQSYGSHEMAAGRTNSCIVLQEAAERGILCLLHRAPGSIVNHRSDSKSSTSFFYKTRNKEIC